jgi:hypothetical protein
MHPSRNCLHEDESGILLMPFLLVVTTWGRSVLVYSLLAISAGLLVFTATAIAFFVKAKGSVLTAFIIAAINTVIHFVGTAMAAPVRLSIKNTPALRSRVELNQFRLLRTKTFVLSKFLNCLTFINFGEI